MKLWSWTASIVAAIVYVLALSHEVYAVTSPPSLDWHVFLRKAYSIVAFALVGYLAGRAWIEQGRRPTAAGCALTIALYSGAIEIGQALHGSHEGLASNAFDVACGAFGGWAGALTLPRSS